MGGTQQFFPYQLLSIMIAAIVLFDTVCITFGALHPGVLFNLVLFDLVLFDLGASAKHPATAGSYDYEGTKVCGCSPDRV